MPKNAHFVLAMWNSGHQVSEASLKISGCRGHFHTFQIELDNLGTKNYQFGPVIKKLQLFEVG